MANTLRFKRGLLAGLPSAAVGEPLFTTDTFDLYIGTASGTQKYQKFIASGTTSQLLRGDGSLLTMPIVLTSPANGEVLKYNGTNWVNSSDAGITGSGVAGQVAYFTGATTQGGSNNLSYALNILTVTHPTGGLPFIVNNGATSGSIESLRVRDNTASIQTYSLVIASGQIIHRATWLGGTGVNMSHIWATATSAGVVAEHMALNSSGRLLLGNIASDNGLRFQVTGDGYFSGSVGIGTSSITAYNLRNNKNITGGTTAFGHSVDGIVQTDVSSFAIYNHTVAQTTAGGTYANLAHYNANQGGIGGTLTNQFGYRVAATLTGATNNYGFYGDIASGTGRWNLYMNGTANNYLAGNLGIGVTAPAGGIDVNNPRSYFRNSGSTGTAIRIISTFTNGRDWGIGGNYVGGNGEFSIYDYTANAERLQINASGNLGLGVTPSAWYTPSTSVLQIRHSSFYSQADGGNYYTFIGNNYFQDAGTFFKYINTGSATQYRQFNGQHIWYNAPSGSANATITFTQAMTLFATGNLAVGTPTDAGYKLDVNGTMRVSGASTFNNNIDINYNTTQAKILILNSSNTTSTESFFQAQTSGGISSIFGAYGPSKTAYKILGTGDAIIYKNNNGNDISILNDAATGAIKMAAGASSTAHFTIASTGAATFSSSVTAGGNLIVDTDTLFVDSSTNRVGIGTISATGKLHVNGSLGSFRVLDSGAEVYFSRDNNNDIYANGGSSAAISIGAQSHVRFLTGTTLTERARFDTTGNFSVDSGVLYVDAVNNRVGINDINPDYTLDVNGTVNSIQARFGNVAGRGLTIGTSAISGTNDAGVVFNAPTATDGTLIFQTTSVERARISGSGNLLINTTSDTGYKLRVNGTSYFDDNLRFPNLKGVVFVQTGGSLLGSIAMDSGNAVTIDNNGFAGLSVGGSYTMTGGNLGIGHSAFGTSATKTISVNSGTAPSTSPADAFQLYSADITAGNAAPHFRTENGAVIKLYQQTTSTTDATYIGGAGTTLTDLDTFDGYRITQIVKALRNAGILQ